MIARITSGTNVRGMVEYNADKEKNINQNSKQNEHPTKGELISCSNIYKEDINTIIKTIETYNSKNKNVKKPNIHISLNFHKNDVLDNQKIQLLTEEYMELMGYGEQPYAVFRHYDRDHPHVHITSTRINEKGKKINDSFEKYKSVRITEALEKKHDLTIAKESQNFKEITNLKQAVDSFINKGEGELVNILSNVVENVMDKQPTSLDQLDYFLKEFNIKRFTNSKGNTFSIESDESRNSRSVPGKSLYNNVSFNNLESTLKFKKDRKQIHYKNVMGRSYSVINKYKGIKEPSINLQDFILELQRKGVKLEVKRRKSGDEINKINGYIFYDIKTGSKYTATDFKLKLTDFRFIIDDKSDLELQKKEKTIDKSNLELLSSTIFDYVSNTTNEEYQEDLSRKKKKKKKRIDDNDISY